MDFLVGTAAGLFRVTDSGTMELLVEGEVRHVVAADEGSVALLADRTLWSIDEDGAAAEFDELNVSDPTCLVLDGDDVWIGTAAPGLVVIREGEHIRVSLDAVEGREAWTLPVGRPAAVRSMDVDDDGALFVSIDGGGILRSLDRGATWLPTIDVTADVLQVVTVPEYAKTVVAACGTGFALSTDQGDSWEVETEGLHAPYCTSVAISNDTVVLAASSGPDGTQAALYRRLIDNSEFIRCQVGLPEWFAGNVGTHCLAAWDEIVIAGVPGGVLYLSTDTGISWRPIVSGLPEIKALAVL